MANYRVPNADAFSYQDPVRGIENNPQTPVKGHRYLIGTTPTGAWSTKANYITYYSGTEWIYAQSKTGWLVFVVNESSFYVYDSGWAKLGVGGTYTPQPSDVYLTVYGDAFTGSKLVAFVVGPELNGKKLDSIILKADIAPIGSNLVCDVHKNNTTVFTTQSNRPKIVDGNTSGTSATPDVQTVATGDLLSLDIDDVGSTVAGGNNLYITMHFTV